MSANCRGCRAQILVSHAPMHQCVGCKGLGLRPNVITWSHFHLKRWWFSLHTPYVRRPTRLVWVYLLHLRPTDPLIAPFSCYTIGMPFHCEKILPLSAPGPSDCYQQPSCPPCHPSKYSRISLYLKVDTHPLSLALSISRSLPGCLLKCASTHGSHMTFVAVGGRCGWVRCWFMC
jgi:hypothetical protein